MRLPLYLARQKALDVLRGIEQEDLIGYDAEKALRVVVRDLLDSTEALVNIGTGAALTCKTGREND